MPRTKRQSLLAPPMWPFKDLETRQETDGSLTFNRQGIEHICQLNRIPDGVFLEPHPDRLRSTSNNRALAWIREWNDLTPHPHWQLEPGEYQINQELLVLHWYLIYRIYGCVPDPKYQSTRFCNGSVTWRVKPLACTGTCSAIQRPIRLRANRQFKALQRAQQLPLISSSR